MTSLWSVWIPPVALWESPQPLALTEGQHLGHRQHHVPLGSLCIRLKKGFFRERLWPQALSSCVASCSSCYNLVATKHLLSHGLGLSSTTAGLGWLN